MFRYKYLCNKVLFFLCCILLCYNGLNVRCTEDVGKGVVVRNESIEDGEVQRVHHGGKTIGVIVKDKGKVLVPQSYMSHGINFKNLKVNTGGSFEECDK